jgi:hypothetical protein
MVENTEIDDIEIELIRGNVKISWVNLGEGFDGDWDPDDPKDENLLRFDVSLWNEQAREFEEVPDASYCTYFSANTTLQQRCDSLVYLMDEIYEPCSQGHPVKKLCERLSFIDS